jgi:hypothetical protein
MIGLGQRRVLPASWPNPLEQSPLAICRRGALVGHGTGPLRAGHRVRKVALAPGEEVPRSIVDIVPNSLFCWNVTTPTRVLPQLKGVSTPGASGRPGPLLGKGGGWTVTPERWGCHPPRM